jgi:hypothetical protein
VVGGLGSVTYGLLYGSLFGVVTFALAQLGLTLRVIRKPAAKPASSVEPESEDAAKQHSSSQSSSVGPTPDPYPRIQDHELPQLLATRWVERRSFQIEQFVKQNAFTLRKDITLQLNHMTFVDCQIYGPAILVSVVGAVGGKTFVDCTWDEEPWQRWRASYTEGYYVGAITLADCVFRNCHFRGVGLVMNPDEYDEKMREFLNP